ncbi:MAG: SusD/RagB family nutrient-binding outer membrane lipoprotein [Cyclobacteriaceae bacterium]|nr:SusD/RagB family nutrient-binding outer membrane lipoprotein [Cyclobacteriaceae bacterium]
MKSMTKYFIVVMAMVVILTIPISCSDQLDINTNPLTASSADPNVVLPFVIVQYSNRKTTEIGLRMMDVWQHISNIFNSPKGGGNAAGGFLSGNFWGMLYPQAIKNLVLVENEAKAKGVTNNNIAAVAITLRALVFYDITACWESAPFTQAMNGAQFPSPEFDDQETILNGIVDLCDEAMALIDAMPATGNALLTGDLIYNGDMTLWRRFANSLKLRVLMMIRNKDTSVDTEIAATLGQPLIETNAHAAMLKYSGTAGNVNAWLQLVTAFGTGSNETTNYCGPSPVIRDLLEGDPRLELWCVDGTNGNYEASDIGIFPNATKARISNNVIRGNLPDAWFLPAEVTLYRAELAAKGVIAGNVNDLYRQGVTLSLQWWGGAIPGAQKTLTPTEISNYVNSLPDITGLTQNEQLQAIGEEQYLQTFWMPIEAWTHVRRTKIPDIQAAPGSTITTMLKRLQWSPTEVSANPNNPIQQLTDVPMWFEN